MVDVFINFRASIVIVLMAGDIPNILTLRGENNVYDGAGLFVDGRLYAKNANKFWFSADGRKIAYVVEKNGIGRLYVNRKLVFKLTKPLSTLGNLSFSPDGRRIAFRLSEQKPGKGVFFRLAHGGKTSKLYEWFPHKSIPMSRNGRYAVAMAKRGNNGFVVLVNGRELPKSYHGHFDKLPPVFKGKTRFVFFGVRNGKLYKVNVKIHH